MGGGASAANRDKTMANPPPFTPLAKKSVEVSSSTHELTNVRGQLQPTSIGTRAAEEKKAAEPMSSLGSGYLEDELWFGLNVEYDLLDIAETIGTGTFGSVYKVHYRGKKIAMKELFLPDHPKERQQTLEDFKKEVQILAVLKHPNIVRFLGGVQDMPHFCLLTELCAGSVRDLLRLVDHHSINVTWKVVSDIALDAAKACEYLHSLQPPIVHRDIKAENLLITDDFTCKLTDFGLSRAFDASTMTVCGTPSWVAPEIFRGEHYTLTVDLYSFGIVLWELVCFKKPHYDQDPIQLPFLVGTKGLRPQLPKHVPPVLIGIMQDCWEEEPDQRPSFKTVIQRLQNVSSSIRNMDEIVDVAKAYEAAPDSAIA